MNNKQNVKKLKQNINILITYLYLNKNNFLPNHQKSPNFYFDHKTIASDLQWSMRKVYNILHECLEKNYIDTVSRKYCPLKLSRLYHINFLNIPNPDNFLDAAVMKLTAERFTLKQLHPKNDNMLSLYLYSDSFLRNMPYGKKSRKSLNFINPLLTVYVNTKNKAECYKPLFNDLVEKINATNRYPCETIYFNEKIIIDKPNINYRIKKSARAASHFCNSSKSLRPEILKILKLPYSYDIPAAVPMLFRLLNHNAFNLENNIRQMIIDHAQLNHIITEKQLKPLLPRFIFTSSYEQSFSQISRMMMFHAYPENVPNVLPYWKEIYDATNEIIGDTSMRTEIFKYESLLELRTVLALRELGYHTSNIYDCFYSEADEDMIKHELTNQSMLLFDDYSHKLI